MARLNELVARDRGAPAPLDVHYELYGPTVAAPRIPVEGADQMHACSRRVGDGVTAMPEILAYENVRERWIPLTEHHEAHLVA